MTNLLNMRDIFNGLDAQRAEAEKIIATYSPEQIAEASRIAQLYDRCALTSLKHLKGMVAVLTR